MPKLSHRLPKYRLHKASGKAVVTIAGKDHYLGEYESADSRREYDRIVAEWLASGRPTFTPPPAGSKGLPIATVLVMFLKHAEKYYSDSQEAEGFKYAAGPLTKLYSDLPAEEFSPRALKAVREEMIKRKWSRRYINAQVRRIRMIFRWAVSEELVPGSVLHALQAVDPLKRGRREDVRENAPVLPVSDATVDQTLQHLPETVADMVRIQRLTGMRPGELCSMRGRDLDTSGDVWTYSPPRHKTAHHGHSRTIFIGPKARQILEHYLRPNVDEHLFQPAESEHDRRKRQHEQRATPLSCGNRPGTNKGRTRKRPPGEAYDVKTYRRAITRACDKAFPPAGAIARKDDETAKEWIGRLREDPKLIAELRAWRKQTRWHPHQLRHTAATAIRKQFGVEGAQAILGHSEISTTQIYAERDSAAAMRIAQQFG